jgi:hypothetical protein
MSARRLAILTEDLVVFLSLRDNCRDSSLKLGHACFVPHRFKFIIHLSFHSTQKV